MDLGSRGSRKAGAAPGPGNAAFEGGNDNSDVHRAAPAAARSWPGRLPGALFATLLIARVVVDVLETPSTIGEAPETRERPSFAPD